MLRTKTAMGAQSGFSARNTAAAVAGRKNDVSRPQRPGAPSTPACGELLTVLFSQNSPNRRKLVNM